MPDVSILIAITAPNEDGAAKALEAFSRPITGLILEGMSITIMRPDNA